MKPSWRPATGTGFTLLGVRGYHRNCRDNMFKARLDLRVTDPSPILASINVFMNIAMQPDGIGLDTRPTVTRPDDHVVLRAELELLRRVLRMSAGHHANSGGWREHPRAAHFEILDSGFPDLPVRGAWVPTA